MISKYIYVKNNQCQLNVIAEFLTITTYHSTFVALVTYYIYNNL